MENWVENGSLFHCRANKQTNKQAVIVAVEEEQEVIVRNVENTQYRSNNVLS